MQQRPWALPAALWAPLPCMQAALIVANPELRPTGRELNSADGWKLRGGQGPRHLPVAHEISLPHTYIALP
eukprot:scaffold322923_cov41-Prasinocladus_malaysianus.AAC.1